MAAGQELVDIYRGAFESAPNGMALLDGEGRIIAVNDRWRQFAVSNGGRRDGYIGMNYLSMVPADIDTELDRIRDHLISLLDGDTDWVELEYPCHSPRKRRWFLMHAARFEHADGEGVLVMHTDITGRRLAEERAREAATRDSLTGLLNRRSFMERARQAVTTAARSGGSLGLLFLDMNGFKAINDGFGHATGDRILKVFGRRLAKLVRGTDAPARIGGDEFVVICPGAGREELERVAERLRDGLTASLRVETRTVDLSCSIGASRYPSDGRTVEELLEAADRAMYRAKSGKNRNEAIDASA